MSKTGLTIQLIGLDGNAMSILGRCQRAMRRNDFPEKKILAFLQEAQAGDYDHLLTVVQEWFEVE